MFGYNGKILRIDLKTGTHKVERLDLEMAKKFIGGRGLGTKIMMDEVDPKVDALSPENKLLVVTGPMTGTPVATGGRYMIVTKSPLSGTIASSNSGGKFGAELKFAGYDVIIFENRAENPVYVNIEDDKVEVLPADALWGTVVSKTTKMLEEKHAKGCKVMAIGPGGENLSKIASIINDEDRAAGRSGVGAVMGSKNLKAVVVKGSKKLMVPDKNKLKEVRNAQLAKIKENGVTGEGLPTYGTAVLVNIMNELGSFPTDNFQKSQFDGAEGISGETLKEKHLIKNTACFGCPIGCGRFVNMGDQKVGGPEYETLWAFGADCGIRNMDAIIEANYWCNEMGIDTISAGATIAAAVELKERGFIKEEELDGLKLEFGNETDIAEWVRRMGYRQGLGDKMADGSYRLTEGYGVPEFSMTVKKLEMPAYDPRGVQGQGLNYATSNRGGCHVRGYLISPEVIGLPEQLDRFAVEDKEKWAKTFQDLTAAIDSLGVCLFTSFALGAEDYADMYNAVCGSNLTGADLLEAGDRIWNLERMFNLEAGISPAEDTLPKRLLTEPIAEGPSKGHVHRLSEMLPKYYKERGWDKNGIPTQEKLESLGLGKGKSKSKK
ncbi:aldehyde:ferredoxin oxidoreductase [Dethiosulfatibacter aminovorans DSM 17477]|uniref:Aldehyde:ferredoxin oxidoreductase n=1 Tax=Dethiosulfatibacter aminovorans DSM 17477 TaxID=1121476 RepID=A0A1M6L943_9FIRM|nr:aldehyde ferredoxin oxidoreductase family protein [Dethiosulfatibacter aminovorans]SHJ67758.1 aldehyde:ferredoxin oxidoreductase [Dethiosulfatibacter aminovorans DSM 17477]